MISSTPPTGRKVDELQASVLRVLLYYDLFNYPLTLEEIVRHCHKPSCNAVHVQECLDALYDEGFVFRYDHFYAVRKDAAHFERRLKGNHEAKKVMPIARKRSEFISRFPFVRCVCLSGSLSKNYFDKTTDIDFFIITEPNRLWLCRSLLILYKKIFLFNSKKYFCVNYFIDTENLEIPDKNIFTATEIITLMPVYNTGLYERFFSGNGWVKNFFPNSSPRKNAHHFNGSGGWMKQTLEKFLSNSAGEWLDQYFFRITLRQWKKKFPGFNDEEFEVNMRSRKNVSKHHPQGFQFKVLKLFEENCSAFEQQHQLTLN